MVEDEATLVFVSVLHTHYSTFTSDVVFYCGGTSAACNQKVMEAYVS